MKEKIQLDDLQEVSARRAGVRERIGSQTGLLRRIMMVAGLAVAGVLGWAGKGRADTFEDYVRDFNDPGNIRVLPPEINTPGTVNRFCALNYAGGNHFRWTSGSVDGISVLETSIGINPDGSISVIAPVTTIYGPDVTNYRDSFVTADGNEFLNTNDIVLRRNGRILLDRTMARDGFDFSDTSPFGSSIAISSDRGRNRLGDDDTGDISLLEENYTGPPMPITTQADFLAQTTLSELNRDPRDRAEVYEEVRAVRSRIHAFVTRRCRRFLGDCITGVTENTWDIFMYDWDDARGSWNLGSETMVASNPATSERGSCIVDTDQAECLVIERLNARRDTELAYACHCEDPDRDGANNCRGDNCPDIANADQRDTDGDGRGDVCDPCPDDATNDGDLDGVCENIDNCPGLANDQSDRDMDGIGDACDSCPDDSNNDIDRDGVCGNVDNCPDVPNPGQENTYGDARGDACEPPPVVDAGVDGRAEGGVDAGMDVRDAGVDRGTDARNDAQRDSGNGEDIHDAGMDIQTDAKNEDSGIIDGNDVTEDTENDIVSEKSKSPPRKPGCACSMHEEKPPPTGIMAMIGLATARVLRRRKRI